jgi:hypothetical protein
MRYMEDKRWQQGDQNTVDGLDQRTYISQYSRLKVKYNTNIQTKPRGRVQIPLLVAGPDATAINMQANT